MEFGGYIRRLFIFMHWHDPALRWSWLALAELRAEWLADFWMFHSWPDVRCEWLCRLFGCILSSSFWPLRCCFLVWLSLACWTLINQLTDSDSDFSVNTGLTRGRSALALAQAARIPKKHIFLQISTCSAHNFVS